MCGRSRCRRGIPRALQSRSDRVGSAYVDNRCVGDVGRQLAGDGVPTITIGIPARYIHSAASMVNRDDFDNATRLLISLIKKLDAGTVADLKR